MLVEHYAQRVLNPFRGSLQVIRYQCAEAITMDGIQWDIYVSNDSLLEGLEGATGPVQISEIRYGKWSADTGLKRGPRYPSDDFYRMEKLGAVVHQALLRLHDKVPFAYRDRYELWRLDGSGQPVVLIDSAVAEPATRATADEPWRIGHTTQAHFVSAALPDALAGQAGQRLMAYINGLTPVSAWFHRQDNGSGIRIGTGEALAATDFPPLLMRASGHPATETKLIEDFLAWQAPCLLLLDSLDPATRTGLEQQARQHAQEVERHCRLYPAVADPAQIDAARVEARLRRQIDSPQSEGDAWLAMVQDELGGGDVV